MSHSGDRPDRRGDFVLLAVFGTLYALTASSHVLGGDTGEFATVGARGGVAHPPGYPLYTLLLRLFSWIPATTPAHAASLTTAAMAVAGLAVLLWAVRSWGGRDLGARLAVCLLGSSPLYWILATQPEVFVLNVALCLAIVGAAGPHTRRLRGVPRVVALTILAGLALSHHHSAVLVAPIGLVGVVRGVVEAPVRAKAVAFGLAGLVLGLTPNLYLLMGHGGAWSWGDTDSLSGLWHHYIRADYGTTQLASRGGESAPMAHIGLMAAAVAANLLYLGVMGALVGLVLAWRSGDRWTRVSVIAFGLSVALAGPLFVSLFNLPPDDATRDVLERFYLLPTALLAVLAGLGLDLSLSALTSSERDVKDSDTDDTDQGGRTRGSPGARVATIRRWSPLVLVGVVVVGAMHAYPAHSEAHSPAVERYLENTLESVPPDALMVGTGDHLLFGYLYLQEARGLRPDVAYVDAAMLGFAFYRARIEGEIGRELTSASDSRVAVVALVEELRATGRPVFLTDPIVPEVVQHVPTWPRGGLLAVVPLGEHPPAPPEVLRINVELFDGYDLAYAFPTRQGSWAGDVHTKYGRTWHALGQVFAAMGNDREAALAIERVRILSPWLLE